MSPRRILTAREQYEMLAPWRTAMSAPIPCQNCGKPKGLHGYGHQFGSCPGQKDRFGPNASRWKPPFLRSEESVMMSITSARDEAE